MKNKFKKLIDNFELFFAAMVVVGVLIFLIYSIGGFTQLDWQDGSVFYEFINRVLILVVGLELAKLLITHDIYAISDLLTFVVARKVLRPNLTSVDILLAIIAFAILYTLNAVFKNNKSVK